MTDRCDAVWLVASADTEEASGQMEESVPGAAADEPHTPSPAGTGLDPNAVYALGSSGGESQRLRRQADELAPDSSELLDRVGLRPGDSAIDLGCGPRGVLELAV